MAIASLVMGILGFIIGLPAALAVIFGGIALSETGKNPNIGGRGMAVAGLILGIIVLVGGLLTIVLIIILAIATAPVYS
jgi:Na+/melibiose symporter-like transporter